jgi:Cu/Ag efflux pump CusA
VWATGAGSELRQALGTAVFFGMLGVTLFGLLFTPVFYVLVRWMGTVAKTGVRSEEKLSLPQVSGDP